MDNSISELNSISSPSPLDETTQQTSKKNTLLMKIVIGQFILLLLLGGVFVYLTVRDLSVSNSPMENPQSEETSATSIVTEMDVETAFLKDREVYVFKKDGSKLQITTSGNSVNQYIFSKDHSKLAYIQGRKKVLDSGYELFEPVKVFFYDLETNQNKEIFAFEPQSRIDTEYTNQIRDVNISDDGTLIAYSTSDSIYLYNILTAANERVFYAPVQAYNLNELVFAYSGLKFSPDNQKILVNKGYWEWSTPAVFDLTDRQMTNLPLTSGNGGGNLIVDWISDDQLLGYEYASGEQMISTYYFTDVSGVSRSNTIKINGALYPHDAVFSRDSQVLYGVLIEQKATGEVMNEVPLYDEFSSVVKLDLSSGQLTKLHTQKTVDEGLYSVQLSSDHKKLFYLHHVWPLESLNRPEKNDIYELNLTSSNARPSLILSDSTFRL